MIEHRNSNPTQPSRVIVLGGSGFVGKDLIGHLATTGTPTLALSSTDIDLSRPESVGQLKATLQESDCLVFVSALTPDKGRVVDTLMQNLRMAENVCACLQEQTCSQVVYISSDAVYVDGANPVREASCASPSSLHGLMHLAREQMLNHTLGSNETPLLILRPSLLYGYGDPHNGYGPNRFLRTARDEGKIVLFGQGEEKRDHVWVNDLSRLIGLGLTHRSQGVLNVATGDSLPFMEIAGEIARATTESVKPDVHIECLPRSTPITHRHFDIGAAYQAFPAFGYTPFQAGLGATLAELRRDD